MSPPHPPIIIPRPGRRPHDRQKFIEKEFLPPEGPCWACGSVLAICQHRDRELQMLSELWFVNAKDSCCTNPDCPDKAKGIVYRPLEEARLALPNCGYGLEIVCFVLEGYMKREQSIPQIHRELQKRGVQVSERHVGNLLRLGLSIVHCHNEEALKSRLNEQGRLIVAIDAVKFDEGSLPLYVIREVLSGEFLTAKRPELRGREQIASILDRVKELGVPVVGVISDKEAAIVEGVAEAFPGVPHHFCHLHYLQNLAIPASEVSSRLGRGVNSVVREVRDLEKAVLKTELKEEKEQTPPLTEDAIQERKLVLKLCKVVSSVGKARGDRLLEPTALKRYSRLKEVEQAAAKAQKREGSWPLLASFLVAVSLAKDYAKHALLLLGQIEVLRKVAHILKPANSSGEPEAALQAFLAELPDKKPKGIGNKEWTYFVTHVTQVTQRWNKGLFKYLEVPGLPATNNDLESFFGAVKGFARRITGRSSTSGGPLETCAEFFVEAFSVLQQCSEKEWAQIFGNSGPSQEQLLQARAKFEELADPAREKRSVARDLEGALHKILEDWLDDS